MEGIAPNPPGPQLVESPLPEPPAPPTLPADRNAAFTDLVNRHSRFLYKVAYSLLKHPQDAEDAVQDALIKLLRSDVWLAMRDERAFLATAVWRSGLDRLSTAAARAMKHSADVTAMAIPSTRPDPEQQAVESSERRIMKSLIDALPDKLRQPLVLSAIEGMKSHEVADILGIADATVRTRILHAKTELRQSFLKLSEGRR